MLANRASVSIFLCLCPHGLRVVHLVEYDGTIHCKEKNLYFLTGSCSWRCLAVSKGNWWQRECCTKYVLVFTCSLCENRHSPLKLNLSLSAAGFKRFLLFTFKGNGICFWFVPHFSVSQRKASYSQSVCRQAGVFDVGYRWQKTDRNSDSNQKNYNTVSANWLRNTYFYQVTTNCSLGLCNCGFSNQPPAISCQLVRDYSFFPHSQLQTSLQACVNGALFTWPCLVTIVVTHAKQQTS